MTNAETKNLFDTNFNKFYLAINRIAGDDKKHHLYKLKELLSEYFNKINDDSSFNSDDNNDKEPLELTIKKEILKYKLSNFSEAISSLNLIYKTLSYISIFLTGIIPGFVSSVKNYDSFYDYDSLNTLEKSADLSSNSLLGSTGPFIDIYLACIPFLDFLISRKKQINNSNSVQTAIITLALNCLFFLPISIVFFDKLAELKIFNENSRYAFVIKIFASFLRSLVISTLLITCGVAFNFLLNAIENKIANHPTTDDNSKRKMNFISRFTFRTLISGILIALARYIIPKLELLTINYLNSIKAGSDLISFTQNAFSSTMIVFSIYCLWARLIFFVIRDASKQKFEQDQTNRFGVSKLILYSFALSFTLFVIKNFIEKYTNQFFLKDDILHAILGFAIIVNIIFCGLLFSSKQNELKAIIDNINNNNDLNLHKIDETGSKKLIIASTILILSISLMVYSFVNEIESGFFKIATNFIQSPLILAFIVFGCTSLLIQGILEKGISNGKIILDDKPIEIDDVFDLKIR